MLAITQRGLGMTAGGAAGPQLREHVLASTSVARLCTVTLQAPPMRLRGTTMTHEYQYSSKEAQALHDLIVERGRHIVRGIRELKRLKMVLEHNVRDAGIVLHWDPSTPPALRERLTVMGLSMMRFSLAGGAIALVLAAFTDKPVQVTAAGIGIAALIGGIHGHLAVQGGWRLRGFHDAQGVECVEVIVEAFHDTTAT